MSVAEMKKIMKAKIENLPDSEVERMFSLLISDVNFDDNNKIDLHLYTPGIFEKYDELMKKLA
jgi:hypothetical protein